MIGGPTPLAVRIAIAALVVIAAAATGLYWAGERVERSVDAAATVSTTAALTPGGVLGVTEELVVTEHAGAVTRVIPAPGGIALGEVRDGTGAPLAHRDVQLAEGLAVTVPLDDPSAVVVLTYDLFSTASAGRDGVELSWEVADDRNAISLSGVDVDITWDALTADRGAPPAAVEVDAPGATPTVLPRDAGVRIELGSVPAHHHLAVHAALPSAALADGVVDDRSVLAGMGEGMVDRIRGGGPWWIPLLVAAAAVAIWVVGHRRLPDEPPITFDALVTAAPTDQTPAEVAWLLRRGAPDADDLVATLVDLHGRGLVTWSAEEGRWTASPEVAERVGGAGLTAHEQALVVWMFAGGPSVSVEELVDRAARDPQAWRTARRAFTDAVDRRCREARLVERTVDSESVVGVGVAASALVVLGVVGLALGQPAWIACILAGAAGLVSTDVLARRSPHGAHLAGQWLAYGPSLAHPAAPETTRGHAFALGVRGPEDDPVIAASAATVDAVEEAFLTATSFVAGPRRRAAARD
ncbi:hypothetical protein [Euzebya sp.]|uniref:DUF2207 family protein n=1 Tax=Euzebya sp. TaxID=1971409 RepID=UPI003515DD4F